MTLRINFNLAAVLTQTSLSRTSDLLTASMQRLSSGVRISRAADDPSGLVIADNLRQLNGVLTQATSNGEAGVSLLQTADGAMDSISATLNRLRTLAVQAANDGVQDPAQLAALQSELDSGIESISQTASTARFGTIPLLQGGLDGIVLSPAALAFYDGASWDATRLPSGMQPGSTFAIAPASAPLTHESVQVSLSSGAPTPPAGTTLLSGLMQNGTTLTIAGPSPLTLTGPNGTQTVQLAPTTTIDDLVATIDGGSAQTGLRAAYDATTGALTVETVGFGAGALDIAGSDLSGGGGIGLLDTDTASPTSNPLQAPRDAFQMALTNGTGPATPGDFISALSDSGTGDAFDAVDGKSVTIYGLGASVTMPLTATTTVHDVVDWVNNNAASVGARASFDDATGTLTIEGARGPLVVASQDLTAAKLGVGLLDRDTGDQADAGTAKTSSAADATIDATYIDANGAARTVELTQDPTSPGGRTFVNLTPGPESQPPYTGWEAGALRVTVKDTSGGAFGGTIAPATATVTGTQGSSLMLQLGATAGDARAVDIPDMRAQALGGSAFRAELASTATTKPLVELGFHSLQDLTDKKALVGGDADEALRVIDAAIDEVAAARGRAGALQSNGVETTLTSLRVTTQNLTAAESGIRDTDFAAESANVTRLQIMMQAATAMLAQANQVPQSVLQLLHAQQG